MPTTASANNLLTRAPTPRPMGTASSRPTAASWLIAIVSVGIAANLLYSCYNITVGFHFAKVGEMLEKDIYERPFKVLLADPRYADFLPSESARLKQAEVILIALQHDHFQQAEEAIRNADLPRTWAYERLVDKVTELLELNTNFESAKSQVEAVSEEEAKLQQVYALLASDLRALLGVSTNEHEVVAGSPVTMTFYQQGILSGLPVVQGIADGINNEEELGQAIGSAPSPRLNEKLNTIREQVVNLAGDIRNFYDRRSQLTEGLTAQTSRVTALKDEAEQLVKATMVQMARPRLRSSVYRLYGNFRALSERVGWQLPELKAQGV